MHLQIIAGRQPLAEKRGNRIANGKQRSAPDCTATHCKQQQSPRRFGGTPLNSTLFAAGGSHALFYVVLSVTFGPFVFRNIVVEEGRFWRIIKVHFSVEQRCSLCDDRISPPFVFGQKRKRRGKKHGGRMNAHSPCQAAFRKGAPRGFHISGFFRKAAPSSKQPTGALPPHAPFSRKIYESL
jgi:hypothetical protein